MSDAQMYGACADEAKAARRRGRASFSSFSSSSRRATFSCGAQCDAQCVGTASARGGRGRPAGSRRARAGGRVRLARRNFSEKAGRA